MVSNRFAAAAALLICWSDCSEAFSIEAVYSARVDAIDTVVSIATSARTEASCRKSLVELVGLDSTHEVSDRLQSLCRKLAKRDPVRSQAVMNYFAGEFIEPSEPVAEIERKYRAEWASSNNERLVTELNERVNRIRPNEVLSEALHGSVRRVHLVHYAGVRGALALNTPTGFFAMVSFDPQRVPEYRRAEFVLHESLHESKAERYLTQLLDPSDSCESKDLARIRHALIFMLSGDASANSLPGQLPYYKTSNVLKNLIGRDRAERAITIWSEPNQRIKDRISGVGRVCQFK